MCGHIYHMGIIVAVVSHYTCHYLCWPLMTCSLFFTTDFGSLCVWPNVRRQLFTSPCYDNVNILSKENGIQQNFGMGQFAAAVFHVSGWHVVVCCLIWSWSALRMELVWTFSHWDRRLYKYDHVCEYKNSKSCMTEMHIYYVNFWFFF